MYQHATAVLASNRDTIVSEIARLQQTLNYQRVQQGQSKATQKLEDTLTGLNARLASIDLALSKLDSNTPPTGMIPILTC